MKRIHYIYIAIGILIIFLVRWYIKNEEKKREAKNAPETRIVYVDGKPTVVVVNPTGPPLTTLKTDPKEFKLQDRVYAAETLTVYKTDSVDSNQQGEIYTKDQEIGRFIRLMPSGRIQMATFAVSEAGVRYIPSNRTVYVK